MAHPRFPSFGVHRSYAGPRPLWAFPVGPHLGHPKSEQTKILDLHKNWGSRGLWGDEMTRIREEWAKRLPWFRDFFFEYDDVDFRDLALHFNMSSSEIKNMIDDKGYDDLLPILSGSDAFSFGLHAQGRWSKKPLALRDPHQTIELWGGKLDPHVRIYINEGGDMKTEVERGVFPLVSMPPDVSIKWYTDEEGKMQPVPLWAEIIKKIDQYRPSLLKTLRQKTGGEIWTDDPLWVSVERHIDYGGPRIPIIIQSDVVWSYGYMPPIVEEEFFHILRREGQARGGPYPFITTQGDAVYPAEWLLYLLEAVSNLQKKFFPEEEQFLPWLRGNVVTAKNEILNELRRARHRVESPSRIKKIILDEDWWFLPDGTVFSKKGVEV